MDSDTVYKLLLDLQVKGDLSADAKKSVAELEGLHGAFERMGSAGKSAIGSIADGFTSMVSTVATAGAAIGSMAIGGALHQLHDGVFNINQELEKTKVSLATTFNVNGVAKSMTDGMGKASDIIKVMRKDAAELPGEFQDLLGIFRLAAVPGTRMGLSIAQIEKLSANVMAGGATAGLQMDMVAREFTELLSGHAGMQNKLGMTLFGLGGDKAKGFNKLSEKDRLKFLTDQFGKFEPSIGFFGQTMDAKLSSLKDNIKGIKQKLTEPLFESVKKEIDWLSRELTSEKMTRWAERVGPQLAHAFERASAAVKSFIPTLSNFATGAHERIAQIWERVAPLMGEAASYLKGMTTGQLFAKIEGIGKTFLAVKAAGMLGGAAGSIMSAGASAGPIGIAVAGGVLAQLAAAGVLAAGALSALTDTTSREHPRALMAMSKLEKAWDGLADKAKVTVIPALETLGVTALTEAAHVAQGLNNLAGAAMSASSAMSSFVSNIPNMIAGLKSPGQAVREAIDTQFGKRIVTEVGDKAMHKAQVAPDFGGDMLAWAKEQAKKEPDSSPKMRGGGGGANVQKVEIVITTNKDPSQIARLTLNEIQKLARHPKISSATPNWGTR